MALEFSPSGCTWTGRRYRQRLEDLNLDSDVKVFDAGSEGLSAVVMACRSTLKTLFAQLALGGVSDDVLFGLVGNPTAKIKAQDSIVAPHFTTQVNALKQTSDETSILHHQFSPNTVLTEIQLSGSLRLTELGFQVLFRFATELVSIRLVRCEVGDSALLVLAETYRNRMKALGLGVPAAWREHELAEERVQAISREGAAAGGHQAVPAAANDATEESSASSDTGANVFTSWHVPGGLKRLTLNAGGTFLTNKGIRAILRCCVGLEGLDTGGCRRLTLELFQGPWACLRLKDLDISGMGLERVSQNFEVFEDKIPAGGPDPFSTTRAASYEEELAESLRFPCAIAAYPEADDIAETGGYDYMTIPGDSYYDYATKPRNIDNTPRQRAILRQFYSKLGQLCQLRTLNMNDSNFRVRVKDGLELALSGLQQNLINWNLDLKNRYYLGNSELEFFGKHFGYGDDFTASEDNDQDCLEGKIRQAKLEHLYLAEDSLQDVCREVKEWATDLGFHLEIDNIEELTITFEVEDEHMEMIVENCAELKTLTFVHAHVSAKNLAVLIPSNGSHPWDIDLDDRPKRRKTQFSSNLESLRLLMSFNLVGPPYIEIVSSLGPQLKRLHLEGFDDITDQDMINAVRRCPNLVELQLSLSCITDDLLINIAEDFLPTDSISTRGLRRRPLEHLNLNWCNEISSEGIIPVIVACRSTPETLSIQDVKCDGISDKVLFALVENADVKTAAEGSKVEPHFTSQSNILKQASDTISIMNHRFSPNTVLTEFYISLTSDLPEMAYE
ncbi:hypothetical protein EC968_007211, partial [Mortierella alpina]